MIKITTDQQIKKVDKDVNVRIRHHAQPVGRVVNLLKLCILSNRSLTIEAIGNDINKRLGYCYKITTPSNKSYYITYDHISSEVFIKNKMRNFRELYRFKNNASDMEIISAVRNTLV